MRRGKERNGLLPNSLRIISSCLKTISSNAGSVASTVRSAGASVAASIAVSSEDEKEQVLWAGFDKLWISSSIRNVLLLGYASGFQVLDVEDASDVHELVSKRDGPVTFLKIQPFPAQSDGIEGFRGAHPLLLVVAGDETNGSGVVQGGRLSALIREHNDDSQMVDSISTPTVVRFFSLKSHNYVHILRFRSAVYVVKCSPRIVAVALAAQIYCFDSVTLENKFSVLTYPIQGPAGINIGVGPIAVGPRWLAYASNNPLLPNTGRLSPRNLTPSPGVSPSSSPSGGSLVARYAMESSKQLAAGLINLSDVGYKTLSKYCQDLLPDGSNSPTSSYLGRRAGRLGTTHPTDMDNAGMVVIKDYVSREVISQFRAHTSPISALFFDPSGTILVTASIHGNNINVFRIMPTRISNGPNSSCYDWTSSHVHLYKLYRGLTTAVIQDICFNYNSQWIAIISSHGTCHIFLLSPFGGNVVLQTQSNHSDGPVLSPTLPLPWWSTSLSMTDQPFLPPPPITLSVISRIKYGNSGWLSSVSNIAAYAGGKMHIPSGAVAAVFHNTMHDHQFCIKGMALEHLLVYSPSGHVVQHELVPFSSLESCEASSGLGTEPVLQIHDEELRVNAEPIQWWDVCRRSSWPEREQCIAVKFCEQEMEMSMDASDCEDNESKYSTSLRTSSTAKCFRRATEKSHWYFSNAEVQVSSLRMPIWQKAKMRFYTMVLPSEGSPDDSTSGEVEIEKYPINEVEVRQRDLMPIFDHHRKLNGIGCLTESAPVTGTHQERFIGDAGHLHPDSASDRCSGVESSRAVGSSLDFEDISSTTPRDRTSVSQSAEKFRIRRSVLSTITVAPDVDKMRDESAGRPLSFEDKLPGSFLSYAGPLVKVGANFENNGASNVTNTSTLSDRAETSADSRGMQEFAGYFGNHYPKVLEVDDCHETTEGVIDADSSSSHCERGKPDEDAGGDDLAGGVFLFSEEGDEFSDHRA